VLQQAVVGAALRAGNAAIVYRDDFIVVCYNFCRPSHAEKTMPVPTEEQWGDYQAELDQEYAHDLFAGHTNEEMQPHFYRNVMERTDELRWMPEVPFRYYMLGFRDFVMAGKFAHLENSNAASCFLGLIEEELESHHGHILPIMLELLPAIRYVGQHQASLMLMRKSMENSRKS
jgi:hypothetical protein